MDHQLDLLDDKKALDLANIRFQLIRLEDTITFYLIERVQFPLNAAIYSPQQFPVPNSPLSLFDWMLREQERFHSRVRRYQAPDEYPFFPDALETAILPPLTYAQTLHPNNVDINPRLKKAYTEEILPAACKNPRRDEQSSYGSSATADVMLIQSLSRRIHFGKFVAESKFRTETERFVDLIRREDREGIDAAITNEKVERKVLERLKLKAKTYGTDPDGAMGEGKVDVDAVVAMYKDFVIPLTKEVEVEYLMQRLEGTEWVKRRED